jgi:hypothetical protein
MWRLSSGRRAPYSGTMKLLFAFTALAALACGAVACAGSSSSCSIPAGTTINVTRANGAGACPATVVSGVTSLNGSDTFATQQVNSCGVTHFNFTVNFFNQNATHDSCQGTEAVSFQNLAATGGTGTETMNVTCAGGVTCSATFDVTWATK